MADYSTIEQKAKRIKNATEEGVNTAKLVGGTILDVLNYSKEQAEDSRKFASNSVYEECRTRIEAFDEAVARMQGRSENHDNRYDPVLYKYFDSAAAMHAWLDALHNTTGVGIHHGLIQIDYAGVRLWIINTPKKYADDEWTQTLLNNGKPTQNGATFQARTDGRMLVRHHASSGWSAWRRVTDDCVASGVYNGVTKKIELKNEDAVVLAEIDASAFVIDGMVNNVEVVNDNLVITFNTDAGSQEISVPISDIFDASNYYTKAAMDVLLASKADADALDALQSDMQGKQAALVSGENIKTINGVSLLGKGNMQINVPKNFLANSGFNYPEPFDRGWNVDSLYTGEYQKRDRDYSDDNYFEVTSGTVRISQEVYNWDQERYLRRGCYLIAFEVGGIEGTIDLRDSTLLQNRYIYDPTAAERVYGTLIIDGEPGTIDDCVFYDNMPDVYGRSRHYIYFAVNSFDELETYDVSFKITNDDTGGNVQLARPMLAMTQDVNLDWVENGDDKYAPLSVMEDMKDKASLTDDNEYHGKNDFRDDVFVRSNAPSGDYTKIGAGQAVFTNDEQSIDEATTITKTRVRAQNFQKWNGTNFVDLATEDDLQDYATNQALQSEATQRTAAFNEAIARMQGRSQSPSVYDPVHYEEFAGDTPTVDMNEWLDSLCAGDGDSGQGIPRGLIHISKDGQKLWVINTPLRYSDGAWQQVVLNGAEWIQNGTQYITGYDIPNMYYRRSLHGEWVEYEQGKTWRRMGMSSAEVNDAITAAVSGNYAPLVNSKVPAAYLPAYVDEVVEGYLYNGAFYEENTHETLITPTASTVYIDLSTNNTYRWGGTVYVQIANDLSIGTTPGTAYDGGAGAALAGRVGDVEDDIVTLGGSISNEALRAGQAEAVLESTKAGYVEVSEYITGGTHAEDAMPAVGVFVYDGNPISHMRTVQTDADSYELLFCVTHLDAAEERGSLYLRFESTEGGWSYTNQYDESNVPVWLTDLFGEYQDASTAKHGLMSAADKMKLNGLTDNTDMLSVNEHINADYAAVQTDGTDTYLKWAYSTDDGESGTGINDHNITIKTPGSQGTYNRSNIYVGLYNGEKRIQLNTMDYRQPYGGQNTYYITFKNAGDIEIDSYQPYGTASITYTDENGDSTTIALNNNGITKFTISEPQIVTLKRDRYYNGEITSVYIRSITVKAYKFAEKSRLATVATSGSYNDLSDKPITASGDTLIFNGKVITFNQDGTVTWAEQVSS